MGNLDFAIVIGIRDYLHIRRLEGAVEDAVRMRDWLLTGGAVPPDNIRLVIGDGAEPGEPVVKSIEDAFDEIRTKAVSVGARRLYVYFAGHGLTAALTKLTLLAANFHADYRGRAIDTESYHETLGNLPLFPEQVFWYDCCRMFDQYSSGAKLTWTVEVPQPPTNFKRLVHYGAAFNDAANERPILGVTRGIFTDALLEGLNGAAATVLNGTAVVVAGRLAHYVRARVDQLARERHLSQVPDPLFYGDAESFVLVDSVEPTIQRVRVRVHGTIGQLMVKDPFMRVVDRHEVVGDQVILLNLPPGVYLLELVPQNISRIISIVPSVRGFDVDLGSTR